MRKILLKKTKTSSYDSAEYLGSVEVINAYMEEALESHDPAFIAKPSARSLALAACRELPKKPDYPVKVCIRP